MLKVKAVLWNSKTNNLGEHPIYIKVSNKKKRMTQSTGYFVPELAWNAERQEVDSKHPSASVINEKIMTMKSEYLRSINRIKEDGGVATVKLLKKKEQKNISPDGLNIFDFMDGVITHFRKTGKRAKSTLVNYQKILNKLEEYNEILEARRKKETGTRKDATELTFEDVDVDYLEGFEEHLNELNHAPNYIWDIWKNLQVFFNMARKKKLITCYPFSEYDNPKGENSEKEYLSLAELDLFHDYIDNLLAADEGGLTSEDIYNSKCKREAALYFLFGCYSSLRVSDWYKFNKKQHLSKDGICNMVTTKTGSPVVIPYHPRLRWVLDKMDEIPLTTPDVVINRYLKVIAKEMGVYKKLTTHCGRKTFAVTLCAERGLSCETCATLMSITVKVCAESYYRVTFEKIMKETDKAWKNL